MAMMVVIVAAMVWLTETCPIAKMDFFYENS